MSATVIFVDDEAEVREGVKRALRHEAFNVITVDSARACMDLLVTTDAQIVISDLHMPDYNGNDLIACLRETHPHITRMVLSGHLDDLKIKDLIDRGDVSVYLQKPCSHQKLASQIRDAIESQHPQISLSQPKPERLTMPFNSSAPMNMTSLVQDAVKEVEKLDRALAQHRKQGSPTFKKHGV